MIAGNNRIRRNRRQEKQVCGTNCCKNGYRPKLSFETLEDRRVLALVGVAPLDFPIIDYNVDGVVDYDNVSDTLLIDATPSLFTPSVGGPGFFFNGTLPADVKINIRVDDTGALLGSTPGDDLIVTGAVDIDGDFVTDFDGVLLTGEVLEFGHEDSGSTTDRYDFRFALTGGLLAGLYVGKDLGVVATSENSSFTGNFTVDFGGNVKGQIGAIEPESELGSIGGVKFAEITECECDKHGTTTEETVIETLAGVTINLYLDNGTTPGVLDGGDTFVDSDVTDGDGEYLFEDLLPGAYLVQEIVPAGYMALTPIVVDVNLTAGSDILNANFLNKLVKASVGNYFFIDSNSNGIQDIGDFGVNGVTVKLLNQFGSVIETTVTANDGSGNAGYYLFYDLNAGNYMIEFVVPTGVAFTIKDVSANSMNTLDSDANSNGRTDVFSLVANQHRRDIDAGVKPEVCVETVVYKVKDYFDKCQQSKAGTIKGVTLEYNDTNEELLVQVTMATYQGRIADGFTIVIDDGSSIGVKAGTHAIFYFDATGANPVLNVFGYNGKNDGSSIKDSNGNTSSYDPDKIATSVNNATGWVKELSVVKSSSKTVFTFRVDVEAINDNSPVFSNINWQGAEIGKNASFVLNSYDGLTTKYDSSGFLTKWSFTCHGGAGACQIKAQKCIVKETIAIDEFFEEWGWETSAFTGNSNGDPLADILWAGSADACQADKDCNRCDDDDDHHGDNDWDWDWDWDWLKSFNCKLSYRC